VQDNELALTEHWNGHDWTVVPAADPSKQSEFGGGGNYLYGVSDGLKPHDDLLAEFPYLGLPNVYPA
jgi:hypothetical protein